MSPKISELIQIPSPSCCHPIRNPPAAGWGDFCKISCFAGRAGSFCAVGYFHSSVEYSIHAFLKFSGILHIPLFFAVTIWWVPSACSSIVASL
jgi:hypothetical protein